MQKRTLSFIITLTIAVRLFLPMFEIGKVQAASDKLERALQWAISIANDNSHGYSMSNRWGNPDYDCSSFVISALKAAGYDVGGATYTQNMRSALTPRGFTWIPWSQIGGMGNLKRGDILLNDSSTVSKQHTEFYLGDGKNVGAHQNYGYPAAGDQTGNEISVRGYYNHPWTGVLRENGSIPDACSCSTGYAGNYTVTTSQYPLTMRSGHGTGYSQVTTIPRGAQVYVSKANGSWAHVEWNGYFGYCSMQYLTKVEEVSPPTIYAWMSETGMGQGISNYRTGKRYYLCYELKDPKTGRRFNEIADANYTITETVYNPDGSVNESCSYQKSDNNWIAIVPEEPGIYRGKVEVDGDYYGDVEISFEVKKHEVVLHAWVSESRMGEKAESYKKGTTYYFCYQIIDKETGELTSDFDGTDYSVKGTIYRPDGSIGDTYNCQNKKEYCMGYRFDAEGTYQYAITFARGDYSTSSTMRCTVEHTHSYTSSITKEPSCTTVGQKTYKCTCGKTYTEAIEKSGHQHTEIRNSKKETCVAEGYSGDTYCSDCGKKLADGNPIAKKSHTIVKDSGKKATCTKDGKTDGSHCKVCGTVIKEQKIIPKTGHTWEDGKITKEPTEKAEGIRAYTCRSCGFVRTEKIPAIGQPGNKDENNQPGGKEDPPEIFDPSETLEVGDIVEDSSGKAMYEVLSIKGGAVCVEYAESANARAASISIPAKIKTDDGIICKVTSVSKGAFQNNKKLKKVVVGSNVKTIGDKAFYGCKNLGTVTLGKNISSIGTSAFMGCTKIKSLCLPSKVTQIGPNAFYGCKALKKLDIKSAKLTARSLGKKAFRGLPDRMVIQVPKSKVRTYKKLFRQRGLSSRNKVR